jgi:predicted DNA-binding transcriptional regulator YafY
VDKKTIYRYINSLNKANIPVYTKKGRYGGFYIDEEFYMKPSKLSEDEIQSLLMAAQILTQENGFEYEKDLQSAVSKIKSLCINDNSELKTLKDNGDFKISEIGCLEDLEDKISKINYSMNRGRSLSINYFSINKNSLTVKKIDPYNLIFKSGAWYVIGYCHMKEQVETFKVSRIKGVKITEEIYMRPHTFDLKEYMDNHWGLFMGEKTKVTVKFDKNLNKLISSSKWHINEEIESLEDGSILFSVYVDETDDIKKWIIGFGKHAEIIEPKQLREEIKQEIKEMIKIY